MTDKKGKIPRSSRLSEVQQRMVGRTAASWRLVYHGVRSEIISMKVRPGDRLSENELARRFGVSRTPAREAMQRLADEGLVEIFPQSGTFVARVPYEELPEAMVIRKALETTTASKAASLATGSQKLTLASIVEQQREAALANDPEVFHAADELFHAKIAEIAGYPGIWKLVLQVKTQVDRYRQLTLEHQSRMFDVIDQHELILSAVENGDAEGAAKAMVAHLDCVLPAQAASRISFEKNTA